MKIINRTFVVVFFLMLWLPILQSAFHLLPNAALNGVELKVAPPVFNTANWFNGKFQRKYEKWLSERIGLRSYFVRTYNQIYLSLFRQLPAGKGTQVIIGKDFWLYESPYIRTYNRNGKTPLEKLRTIVSDLKTLQDKMKIRQKVLLLVIAPSKVEIYPEFVPDGMLESDRQARKTEYDRMLPLLDEYGVNYLDVRKIFMEKKESQPYSLFAMGGTHWNYYGAGMIVELIMAKLGQGLGRKLPGIKCRSVNIDRKPFGTDNDLCDLLNIWFPKSITGPQIHPVFDRQDGEYLPNLLFIGDSFVFTLTDIICRKKLCSRCDIFYYFKRHFTFMNRKKSNVIDSSAIDWEKELLARDAVVIEINEHWLPNIGFGFVKAAISGLTSIENTNTISGLILPKK
ncbi:MAG: hypothetical protein PHI84_11575 [Kiritimatiellae bacterium]|nr:hypothetical protein [Kiritimatiellia bacterium]